MPARVGLLGANDLVMSVLASQLGLLALTELPPSAGGRDGAVAGREEEEEEEEAAAGDWAARRFVPTNGSGERTKDRAPTGSAGATARAAMASTGTAGALLFCHASWPVTNRVPTPAFLKDMPTGPELRVAVPQNSTRKHTTTGEAGKPWLCMIQTRATGVQLTPKSFTTSHTRFGQGQKTSSDTIVHLDNEMVDPHFFSRILKQSIKERAIHGSGLTSYGHIVPSSGLKHAPPCPPPPNTTTPRLNEMVDPPFFFASRQVLIHVITTVPSRVYSYDGETRYNRFRFGLGPAKGLIETVCGASSFALVRTFWWSLL